MRFWPLVVLLIAWILLTVASGDRSLKAWFFQVSQILVGVVVGIGLGFLLDKPGERTVLEPPKLGPATRVKRFVPPRGTPNTSGLDLRTRGRGKCFRVSLTDPGNPNARACFDSKRRLRDPCFAHPALGVWTCFRSPWPVAEGEDAGFVPAVGIRGTGWLRPPRGWGRSYEPWALELRTKERCIRITIPTLNEPNGTTYRCKPKGALIGYPDPRDRLWKVQLAEGSSSETVLRVVRVAWY